MRRHTALAAYVVALLASLGGTDAYHLSGQPFARNFTCLVGNMQYLGIPSDPCSGIFPDKFNTMQAYLAAVGIGNYNHENMDTTPRDMIEYDCYNIDHQEGPGGKIIAEPSPWYCSQALTFSPAFGASICQNKFTSHALNPNYPADESLVQTWTVPQGCSKSCNCCGPRCHWLSVTKPDVEAEGLGMVLFFHDYTGDGSWSNSQFHLQKLTDPHNLLIVAPNGRQDDMAYGHWMGTEHFTGYYLMFLNEVTNTPQQANWWQFNATTQVQQTELRSNNIDVFYAKRVITHYLTARGVDQTRVYFMGDGNGADMAYHMACNESNLVSNLILRDATPFKVVTNCQPRSPMHVLIHQHRSDSVTAQKLVQFWAKMNGCTKDSIGDQPDRIVQILYNGTKYVNGSHYELTTSVPRADGKLVRVPTGVVKNDTYVYHVDKEGCHPGGSVTMWISENIPYSNLDEDTYPMELSAWIDSTRYKPPSPPLYNVFPSQASGGADYQPSGPGSTTTGTAGAQGAASMLGNAAAGGSTASEAASVWAAGGGAQVWLALILLPPCAVFIAFQFGPCKRGWEREEAVGGAGEKIYGTFEGSEELEPLVGSVDPSPEPEL